MSRDSSLIDQGIARMQPVSDWFTAYDKFPWESIKAFLVQQFPDWPEHKFEPEQVCHKAYNISITSQANA